MINLEKSSFFLPTREFRKLSILLTIYHAPMISQQAMAMQSNLSSGMVNRYVHELEEAQLINIENRNRRDKKYSLTPSKNRSLSWKKSVSFWP